MKRILVFDSGVGGLSVLDAIAQSGVEVELDYLADTAWLPYGGRPEADIAARVPPLLQSVARQWAPDLIVIACNTASTIVLPPTRALIALPIVGVVPPIKPAAAATQTGVIGLLATPATARRAYTDELIAQFAADKIVIKVGSTELVNAAEEKLRGGIADPAIIKAVLAELFGAPDGERIDTIALSCTHFPLLREELAAAAPRMCAWVDSGAAIARRVRALLDLPPGASCARNAAFTGAGAREELDRAFRARGFTRFASVAETPDFSVAALG